MKKFFAEFKEFAMRGNVMDMAVGVIIGTAFGKITTSLVNDEGGQQLPQPRFRRGGAGFLNSLFHTALLTSVFYAGRG